MRNFTFLLAAGLWLTALSASACEPLGWGSFLAPGPQTYEVAEVIDLSGGRKIMAIKFGPLKGERAKIFLFLQMKGDCYLKAVSHGSYGYMIKKHADGTVSRSYHLDLYKPGMHATLGMSKAPLSYEEVRARAMENLQ